MYYLISLNCEEHFVSKLSNGKFFNFLNLVVSMIKNHLVVGTSPIHNEGSDWRLTIVKCDD